MVRKIFEFFHRDVVGIHRIAYLLAGSAFLSQILALLRDRLLAEEFGASISLDIYYAAFRLQDILFFTFASLLSLSVLIPFLIERIDDESRFKEFINTIFTAFFVGLSIGGAVLFVLAPIILPIIFPGLWGKGYDAELTYLTRILLLSPLFLGLSNLLASASQVYQKFYLYALSPVLYNLGIIIGITLIYPHLGLPGLAYGVIIGALFHLGIQLPFAFSRKLFPSLTFRLSLDEVLRVVSLSLPRTLTLSLNYVVLLVFTGLASLMAEGSISVFSLSLNLQSVPIALIGASYSVAAFPVLAKYFSNGEFREFLNNVSAAARHIIFWSLPLVSLFIVLRAHIVRIVFGGGEFDWTDTRLTAAALALFTLSIPAQSLSLLFIRSFYAMGKTKIPLLIVGASSIFTVIFALLAFSYYENFPTIFHFFQSLLRVEGLPGVAVLILPLSFSLGSLIQVLLLRYFLDRNLGFSIKISSTFLQGIVAGFVGGVAAYFVAEYLGKIYGLSSLALVFGSGAISGTIGIGASLLTLYLLKSDELMEIIRSFRARFRSKDIIISGE